MYVSSNVFRPLQAYILAFGAETALQKSDGYTFNVTLTVGANFAFVDQNSETVQDIGPYKVWQKKQPAKLLAVFSAIARNFSVKFYKYM